MVQHIKIREIILKDVRFRNFVHDHFEITEVVNTTKYRIGDFLSTTDVEELCEAPGVKVIIK